MDGTFTLPLLTPLDGIDPYERLYHKDFFPTLFSCNLTASNATVKYNLTTSNVNAQVISGVLNAGYVHGSLDNATISTNKLTDVSSLRLDTSNIASGASLSALNVRDVIDLNTGEPLQFLSVQIPWDKATNIPVSSLAGLAGSALAALGGALVGAAGDALVHSLQSGTPSRVEASNVYGGLSNATLMASNLQGYYTTVVPSKDYVEPHQFYEIIDYTTSPVTVTDVPLATQPANYSLQSTSHSVYPTISVPASNVVSDGSALDETIMPTYLHASKTLLNTTTVVKSVGSPHIVPGVYLVDGTYYDIVETDSVKEDVTSYQYTLDNVKIDYTNVLNTPLNYIKDEMGAFHAINLAGSNIVSKQTDKIAGSYTSNDNWYGHCNVITYIVNEWVASTRYDIYGNPVDWGAYADVTHTCNVFVQDSHAVTHVDNNVSMPTIQHTLFPSFSINACNVIGGSDNVLLEETMPYFLTPTKLISFTSNTPSEIVLNNGCQGVVSQIFTSNIRYMLPKVMVASENVKGDYLTVNSNISTSNIEATTLKIKTGIQVVNGAVNGSYLNMTSATASNVISGVLYVKGITTVGEYPTKFREFKCGSDDPSNTYAAEGDPECGYFGGFDDMLLYVSTNPGGFLLPYTQSINPDQRFKAMSRYHVSQAFDDAQHDYTYGHANGQRVYAPDGYHYSIKTTGSIWSGNKLLLSSDARIKKDIKPLNSNVCLLGLQCLKPSAYKTIADDQSHIGFIAQEVREYLPQAISICEGEIGGSNVPDFHTLDYNTITTICVGAIQTLCNEMAIMKKEIYELKNIVKLNGVS